MFTVWHGLFSLVLMFSGLRIEAPLPSTIQGKCIYVFLKKRTSRFNFRSYILNLVKINISFFFQRLVVLGRIYRSPVPSKHYKFDRLSAKHARTVESSGAIYPSNVPIRQDFSMDFSANCSLIKQTARQIARKTDRVRHTDIQSNNE